ncbi:MAG: histidine triad nucleotide-binding protein [Micavibrio aeruginosavorus]|uniref:Histidine triad nucleotide-binding protein n=1 Tax=Micavibrio aeruginosavorus TaxID=349221 RepID=A0A7T5UIT9_9BACT|nr:MAG: histidine triad nucleotide-binding protein [Micavibrio aeruginosavorus]
MSVYDDNNVFAKILRREIPCQPVYEDEHVLAFPDIAPKAPVHILVIPKGRYVSVVDFGARASTEEITAFWRAVAKLAAERGLPDSGFRTIANTGLNGGQEVPHFHVHILGGRALGPMLAHTA